MGARGLVPSIHHVTRPLAPRPRSALRPPSPRRPAREKSRALCALFFCRAVRGKGTNGTTGKRPHDPGKEPSDERRAAGSPADPGPSGAVAGGRARRRRAGPADLRQAGARWPRRRRADGPHQGRLDADAPPVRRRGDRDALGSGVRQPAAGPARAEAERPDRVRGPRQDRHAGRARLARLPRDPRRERDLRRVDRPRPGQRRSRGDAAAGRGETEPGGGAAPRARGTRRPSRGARSGRVARQRAGRAPGSKKPRSRAARRRWRRNLARQGSRA